VKLASYHPAPVFEVSSVQCSCCTSNADDLKAYGLNGVDYPLAKRATPEEAAKSFLQDKLGVTADALTRHAGHTWDSVSYEYFTQTIVRAFSSPLYCMLTFECIRMVSL
jgi:hypothetical protein